MTAKITPKAAQALVTAGGEAAFLDLREAGPFSLGHPLFAVPCSFGALELRAPDLVPRLAAPVLLIDGGCGAADPAAKVLARMGYEDVRVVEGGTRGWVDAGLTLYCGVNVPSKVMGELVEEHLHPPMVTSERLAAWQAEGRGVHLFDCRPATEYAQMTVPGAACLPNGELPHRLPALELSGPVVLTCAGRTRGILGAAALRRMMPDTEVYALENGTQGWALAGLDLARGTDPQELPPLDAAERAATRRRADAFIEAEGIARASVEEVTAFVADQGRTTFLIDVRSAEEAASDPLPSFQHALSGQLVQATDAYAGVRRARLVLADDCGLRAALAAWWLRAMGFEPVVTLISDRLRRLSPPKRPAPPPTLPGLSAHKALAAVRAGSARFVDLRSSAAFRDGHIAGSLWATRADLPELTRRAHTPLHLLDDGDGRAAFAARGDQIRWVTGGIDALKSAGAAIEKGGLADLYDRPDVTWFAYGRHDGDLLASRTYLAWETGLVAQLTPEERRVFNLSSLAG